MLLSLNDDCLRYIMEFLDLKDQVAMAHVSERLRIIALEMWLHKEVTVTKKQLQGISGKYFREYMHYISDDVENLKLMTIDAAYFDDIKDIQFPKVHSLLVNMSFGRHCNDSVIIIKNIFPKLTSLDLYGCFTGEHLKNFENLEELNLDGCEFLQTKYFKKIFSKLKKLKKLSILYDDYGVYFDNRLKNITACKTLEEICMNDYHLLWMHESLFKMKKLRKILCRIMWNYKADILEQIVNSFGKVLHTMIFDNSFRTNNKHCISIQKMITLRRLIFYNDAISNKQLHDIGASLCNTLEEFYFRKGRHINYVVPIMYYDGLLDVVRQCMNLKIFDLSGTTIDVNFVEKIAKIIAFDDEKRNQILLMRCHGTSITREQIKTINLPEKLKISFEHKELNPLGEGFFQCEWSS